MKKYLKILNIKLSFSIYFLLLFLELSILVVSSNSSKNLYLNSLKKKSDDVGKIFLPSLKVNINDVLDEFSYIDRSKNKNISKKDIENIYLKHSDLLDGIVFLGGNSAPIKAPDSINFSLADSYLKKSKNGDVIIDKFGDNYVFAKIFKSYRNRTFISFFNIKKLFSKELKKRDDIFNNDRCFYDIKFKYKKLSLSIYSNKFKNGFLNKLLFNKLLQNIFCYHVKKRVVLFNGISVIISFFIFKWSNFLLFLVFLFPFLLLIALYFFLKYKYNDPIILLIKKLSSFRLGDSDETWLPFDRNDIIGALMREFGNTYGDILDMNKQIMGINEELSEKSKFIDQKLLEVDKLKELVFKSFTQTDDNELINELLVTFKDVFKCTNVILANLIENADGIVKLDIKSIERKESIDYVPFLRQNVKKLIDSNNNILQINKDNNNFLMVKLNFDSKLLSIIVLIRKNYQFKRHELNVVMTFAGQATIVLENNRLYKQEVEKIKMDIEMAGAKDIQKLIITKDLDFVDGVNVINYYKPAVNVGGDWYDYFKIDENNSIFLVADITGHGTSSALITSIFSTYFSVLKTLFGSNVFNKYGLESIISGLNKVLYNLTGGVKQATMAVAAFDRLKNELTYLSAGHNSSLLFSGKKNKFRPLQTRNPRLGDTPTVKFKTKKISVEKNDKLFIFTDGLIENKTKQGLDYGKKRLMKLLENNMKNLDIVNVNKKLRSDIETEFDLKALEDDITYLLIEFM